MYQYECPTCGATRVVRPLTDILKELELMMEQMKIVKEFLDTMEKLERYNLFYG
jgi:hypothetical protein